MPCVHLHICLPVLCGSTVFETLKKADNKADKGLKSNDPGTDQGDLPSPLVGKFGMEAVLGLPGPQVWELQH